MRKYMPNMTLRLKLIAGFGCILLIFLAVVSNNILQVRKINSSFNVQSAKMDLKLKALELKVAVQDIKDISSGIMISRKTEFVERYQKKRPEFQQMIIEIGETAVTPDQLKWRSQLIMASTDFLNSFDQAVAIIQDKNLKEVDIQKNTEFLYNQSQQQRDAIFALVDNFYTDYSKDADRAVEDSLSLMKHTQTLMLLAGISVLLVSMIVSSLIIVHFGKSIRKLLSAVVYISKGDLSHKINSRSRDELGELSRGFDNMADHVSGMLARIKEIAGSLSGHSQEFHRFSQETAAVNTNIVRAIEEISVGADQQAQQSERSSSLIHGLDEEINGIRQHSGTMEDTSKEAEANIRSGTESVDALRLAAGQTEAMADKVMQTMNTLSASSARIGKIVQTITDISAQTNVLSLNAAIEAARAGAAGKGFSVIAEEVRVLSQQTNDSSKDIAHIIETLQHQMNELEEHMSGTRKVLDIQQHKVEETLAAFSSIQGSMNDVSEQIVRIRSQADSAQSRNNELVQSVQVVAAVAEETAAGVQEVNSASLQQDESIRYIAGRADDINKLSMQLFEEISKFKTESENGN